MLIQNNNEIGVKNKSSMPFNKKKLDNFYESVSKHKSHFDKAQGLTTIIEIKQNNPQLVDFHNSLYLDTKIMLVHYIHSRDGKDYGYDKLDCDFIKEHIEQEYLTERQQLALYGKASSCLKAIGEDVEWIKKRELEIKLKIFSTENRLKYIIALSGKSKKNCLLTLLGLFVVECLVLLPIADDEHALFVLTEEHYSNNEFVNYIANVLALRLEWITGPELHCLSWIGVAMVLLWLVIYLVFVANILFKNLFKNIDIYEIPE